MFFACVFATLGLQAGQPVVKYIANDQARDIHIEVMVGRGESGPFDDAVAQALAEKIVADTRDYGQAQMRQLTSRAGDSIVKSVTPSCIRIGFGVSFADAAAVAPLVDNLAFHASLSPNLASMSVSKVTSGSDPWLESFKAQDLPMRDVRGSDLGSAYKRLFRASNLTVIVSGPKKFDSLAGATAETLESEPQPRQASWLKDLQPYRLLGFRRDGLDSFIISSPSFSLTDFPAILSVFALGSGKTSAIWQVLRQDMHWSYRQEVDIVDAKVGLRAEIVAASNPGADLKEISMQTLTSLLTLIDRWTEADRKRVSEIAKGVLLRDVGMNPFDFFQSGPVATNSPTFASFWLFKTGQTWDPAMLAAELDSVTLDQLRSSARDLLQRSSVFLRPNS